MAQSEKSTSMTLLERARGKDQDAWQRLLFLYAPLVERWCAARGVRGQDADDVRQEVFQAVAAGLDGFKRERTNDTFRGWLRGITRHKILDHFRKRGAREEAQGGTDAQRQLLQIAEQEFPADTEEDLGGLYRRALELVRSEFEERTWEAFRRSAIENQAPAVIAADMGVTPAAVRKAKSRVLHRLRQEIGDLID
jgi:RNA polymerase sigma-70 factor (ECF subfamily)